MNEMIEIQTATCFHCNKSGTVALTLVEYEALSTGSLVQVALPDRPAEFREQVMTGTHPECWEEMFSEYADMDDLD